MSYGRIFRMSPHDIGDGGQDRTDMDRIIQLVDLIPTDHRQGEMGPTPIDLPSCSGHAGRVKRPLDSMQFGGVAD